MNLNLQSLSQKTQAKIKHLQIQMILMNLMRRLTLKLTSMMIELKMFERVIKLCGDSVQMRFALISFLLLVLF